MKTAFYFSGRISTYHKRLDYLKKIQEINNADFFCSINGEMDAYHEYFIKYFDVKSFYIKPYIVDMNHPSIKNLKKRERIGVGHCIENASSMFYNRKICQKLISEYEKKNGFEYDIICCFRTDVISNEDFKVSNEINENEVYVPLGQDWGGLNDQIAYGKHNAMEHYSKAYDFVLDYGYLATEDRNPEYFLMKTLEHYEIAVKRFKYEYVLDPDRKNKYENILNDFKYMIKNNQIASLDLEFSMA